MLVNVLPCQWDSLVCNKNRDRALCNIIFSKFLKLSSFSTYSRWQPEMVGFKILPVENIYNIHLALWKRFILSLKWLWQCSYWIPGSSTSNSFSKMSNLMKMYIMLIIWFSKSNTSQEIPWAGQGSREQDDSVHHVRFFKYVFLKVKSMPVLILL